jgi:hypothetical protein
MMEWIAKAGLLIAGAIHLLPVAGVTGAERLSKLYGIDLTDPNLVILMRHRALLFGILGAVMIAAAFTPQLRFTAILAGLISAASFLIIAYMQGGYGAAIRTIVLMDWIAVAALVVAAFAAYSGRAA